MNLFLIGLSGSGKSFWAEELARNWQWDAIDTDAVIASRCGMSVAEIFQKKGEAFFREHEKKLLQEIIHTLTDRPTIVATGGGTPCFDDNLDAMMNSGLVVYLEAPIELLTTRLERSTDRPLLMNKGSGELREKLETLLASRKKIYERAPIKIDAATATTSTFAAAIAAFNITLK
jgi:shikimate kinase